MKVTFQCPHCSEEIAQDASLAPLSVECPKCNQLVEAPVMRISTGTVLGGFRVEKLLGKGAMGQVYLATQLSMGREVALKILPPEMVTDEDQVKRFLHEVQMLARVEHPNIVMAFEAGEDQGVYFLAMSYVRGEKLVDRLKREGRMSETDALTIVLKVAKALSHVWNQHQMLHNDIKPENIIIDEHDDVRIMDMGLSKTFLEETGLSMTGVTFGTPNYMSPEQSRGDRDLDFKSDQYALGTVLYHMVTGELPYDAPSVAELLTKKLFEPCESPKILNPDLSDACELIICVMLAYERDSRYPTWEALIGDLERVLRGEAPLAEWVEEGVAAPGVESADPGPGSSVASRKQSRRRFRIVAAAVGILILGGGIWFLGAKFFRGGIHVGPTKPGIVLKNMKPPAVHIVHIEKKLLRGQWQDVALEVRNLALGVQGFESATETTFKEIGEAEASIVSVPAPVHAGEKSLLVQGGIVTILPNATPLNVLSQTHIGIWIYDAVFAIRPVQITLRDALGAEQSAWSDAYTQGEEWVLITWPTDVFTAIDRTRVTEMTLTVGYAGTYYFDDLFITTECDLKAELKDGAGAVQSASTLEGFVYTDGSYSVSVQTPHGLIFGWDYYTYAFLYPRGTDDPWKSRLAEDATKDDLPWSKVVQ